MTDREQAEVTVTARLLGAAWPVSLLIAIACPIAAVLLVTGIGNAAAEAAALVLGLAGSFFSIRVAFDAGLLRDAAERRWAGEVVDAHLAALGLRKRAPEARSWQDRCRGAVRLVRIQAVVMLLELTCMVAGAFIR